MEAVYYTASHTAYLTQNKLKSVFLATLTVLTITIAQ